MGRTSSKISSLRGLSIHTLTGTTALAILHYLLVHGKATTIELQHALGLEQSRASHQIQQLYRFGVISKQRIGKTKELRLTDPSMVGDLWEINKKLERRAKKSD